jgi:hypothetical protein
LGDFSPISVFKNRPSFGSFFPNKSNWLIFTKMGWATSWAIFWQAHLVTLHAVCFSCQKNVLNCWKTKLNQARCLEGSAIKATFLSKLRHNLNHGKNKTKIVDCFCNFQKKLILLSIEQRFA